MTKGRSEVDDRKQAAKDTLAKLDRRAAGRASAEARKSTGDFPKGVKDKAAGRTRHPKGSRQDVEGFRKASGKRGLPKKVVDAIAKGQPVRHKGKVYDTPTMKERRKAGKEFTEVRKQKAADHSKLKPMERHAEVQRRVKEIGDENRRGGVFSEEDPRHRVEREMKAEQDQFRKDQLMSPESRKRREDFRKVAEASKAKGQVKPPKGKEWMATATEMTPAQHRWALAEAAKAAGKKAGKRARAA